MQLPCRTHTLFIDILRDRSISSAIETCEFNLKIDSRCRQWQKREIFAIDIMFNVFSVALHFETQ